MVRSLDKFNFLNYNNNRNTVYKQDTIDVINPDVYKTQKKYLRGLGDIMKRKELEKDIAAQKKREAEKPARKRNLYYVTPNIGVRVPEVNKLSSAGKSALVKSGTQHWRTSYQQDNVGVEAVKGADQRQSIPVWCRPKPAFVCNA